MVTAAHGPNIPIAAPGPTVPPGIAPIAPRAPRIAIAAHDPAAHALAAPRVIVLIAVRVRFAAARPARQAASSASPAKAAPRIGVAAERRGRTPRWN
jgi:hypothetical protein